MAVTKQTLRDKQAKEVLRKWPMATTKLWPPPNGSGAWIRAQPKDGTATGPVIQAPGSDLFATQPDGLWVHFNGLESCDLVVVEVCGSIQNLNDKRSRYMPSTHSLVLKVVPDWANEVVPGGYGRRQRTRRDLAKTLPALDADHVNIPIRVLRVLYALTNEHYKLWVPNHVPTGYEFFIPHSSLGTYNSKPTQEFLKRMSVASQFRSLPQDVRVMKAP